MDRTTRRKPLVLALIALGALCFFPLKRTTTSEWKVLVVDETGAPFANVEVSRSWDDHSHDMSGSDTLSTNAAGELEFPRRAFWRPLVVWGLSRALSATRAEAESGLSVRVGVETLQPHVEIGEAGLETCGDECRLQPRQSTLRVFDARHSESATRARLDQDEKAFEKLAEDLAVTGISRVGRDDDASASTGQKATYRWGDWQLTRDGDTWTAYKFRESFKEGLTLPDAAAAAGTTEAVLTSWFDRLTSLGVHSLARNEEIPGVIEIRFPPGTHALWYAVRGNDQAVVRLDALKSQYGQSEINKGVKHVRGRWYYFTMRVVESPPRG